MVLFIKEKKLNELKLIYLVTHICHHLNLNWRKSDNFLEPCAKTMMSITMLKKGRHQTCTD